MKCSLTVPLYALLALAIVAFGAPGAPAQELTPRDAALARMTAAARREVEIARLKLRLYERVEHPTRRLELEHDIELTHAEIATLHGRLDNYREFTRNTHSAPLLVTIQDTQLLLLEANQRLKEREQSKLLLLRHHKDRRRLLELAVEATADQAAALRELRAGPPPPVPTRAAPPRAVPTRVTRTVKK